MNENVVPESVIECVQKSLHNLEDLRTNLIQFLSICESDVLADLSPLQRANAFLMLAKAVSTLFMLRLRCSGLHPDDHSVKTEIERLCLYEDKLERYMDWDRAPLRPSTTINSQAVARFIEHSLPDLTPEQKQSMREIGRGGGKSRSIEKRITRTKRKYRGSEKKSVQVAAQEFLEKATRELLGAKCDAKGPLSLLGERSEEDERSEDDDVSTG